MVLKSNKAVKKKEYKKKRTVKCPYCHSNAKLVDSHQVYHRSYGMIWLCQPCDAYVGVHKESRNYKPLGRLANQELRKCKIKAHRYFDPLWQNKMVRDKCSKTKARQSGYAWLAKKLGLTVVGCHIGQFNVKQCRKVVEICLPYHERHQTKKIDSNIYKQ